MITRDELMNFFRNDEDCENLYSLSESDRYELMILFCAHNDDLENKVKEAIASICPEKIYRSESPAMGIINNILKKH